MTRRPSQPVSHPRPRGMFAVTGMAASRLSHREGGILQRFRVASSVCGEQSFHSMSPLVCVCVCVGDGGILSGGTEATFGTKGSGLWIMRPRCHSFTLEPAVAFDCVQTNSGGRLRSTVTKALLPSASSLLLYFGKMSASRLPAAHRRQRTDPLNTLHVGKEPSRVIC